MRVLLATPPQPMSSILPRRFQAFSGPLKLLGGNRPILGLQPPYGLLYLAAYLRRAGHEVSIVDGLCSPPGELLRRLEQERPDLVGLSCVTFNWSEACRLARDLKARFPALTLALGGAHVNAVRGQALADCPEADAAFYGDAEQVFAEYTTALGEGRAPGPLDGFAYREHGRVVASPKDALITDLDAMLLPEREHLGLRAYRPSPQSYRRLPFAAVFGSRGCPGRCTFCHTVQRTRLRSAESLVAEIQLLQARHGVREVLFYDDNFTLDRRRVLRFCALLQERRLDLSWAASARVDTVDPELLAAMKRAGCWRLLLGLETGSERLLARIRKDVTLDQARKAVAAIRAAGLQTYGMFIFGLPTETRAEGLQTIAYMKSLDLDFVNVASLTPFPGTAIYDEVRDEPGFKGFDAMNMYDVSYVPATMTEAELTDLLRRAFREFYLRLPYVLGQLRNVRSVSDAVRYVRGGAIVLLR